MVEDTRHEIQTKKADVAQKYWLQYIDSRIDL